MRRVLPATALFVATLASGRAAADAPPSLRILRETIAGTESLLDRVVGEAKKDPRLAKVEKYLGWNKPEEFANPRRDVGVRDLVKWLADVSAPTDLREACKRALLSMIPRGIDPDLDLTGNRSRRGQFSRASLVPLLGDGRTDDFTRAAAAEILDSYWHASVPDVKRYNPRDEATWGPARAAWNKILAQK